MPVYYPQSCQITSRLQCLMTVKLTEVAVYYSYIDRCHKQVTQRKCFFLHSFQQKIEDKALPLAYKGLQKDHSKKPDENVGCDLMEACQCTCISSSNKLKRLACFHVFHEKCLEENEGRCPKCTAFLMSKTVQLTKSFNEGLLSTSSSPSVSEESALSDSNLDDDSVTHNNPKDSSYYASEELQQEIDAALNTVHVPQPSQQPVVLSLQIVQLSKNQF